MRPILIVPGFRNSGPDHWQTRLERKLPRARRVDMKSWSAPRRIAWVRALDRAVAECHEPPVLVAHSLGCIAVAHWAAAHPSPIHAALLVAPCDVETPALAETLPSFAPSPRSKLPFPSVLVASTDDPYLDLGRAAELAGAWGSQLRVLVARGHINVESGFGPWPEGEELLEEIA